jgi:hypothetical protein
MTNQTKSSICRTANYLVKQGHSRSEAFRLAWVLAKGTTSAVAGVSFGKRPLALLDAIHARDGIPLAIYRLKVPPVNAAAFVAMADNLGPETAYLIFNNENGWALTNN